MPNPSEEAQSAAADSQWVEIRAQSPLDTQALNSALNAVVGVQTVALTSPGTWAGLGTQDFLLSDCGRCFIGGLPTPWKGETAIHAWVDGDALSALNVLVVAGRSFSTQELATNAPLVLVSQGYANENFEDGQAVGRSVRVGRESEVWHEVIGVVAAGPSAVALGASAQVRPWVLLPLGAETLTALTARIEGVVPAAQLKDAVTTAVPGATVTSLPYPTYSERQAGPARWLQAWLVFLGVAALAVALIGVFTATLAQVQQRRTELAVRRSVGAPRVDIIRRVLGQATRIAAIGVPLGLWVSTFGLGALRHTSGAALPSGPLVATLLTAIWICCLAGGLVPAVRTARLPPAEALRQAE